jgi:large subunit ribosomal protein L21
MYAIVKTGGKQYRVERGQRLLVERLAAEEGSDVELRPLMYRSEETVFDGKGLEQVQVTARVLGHERGEKLRVVKFKPKRGYKRRTGHRQELTRIEIVDIALAGKGAARKTAKPAAASNAETEATASTKHAEAKPAAAKAAAVAPAAAKAAAAELAEAKPAAAKAAAAKPAAADGAAKEAKAAKEATEDGA